MDRHDWLSRTAAAMHPRWGGRLCLDFANTLEPRGGPPPITLPPGEHLREEIPDYAHLVAWVVHAEALAEEEGAALLRAAERRPDAAEAVLRRAHALRDAIYRVFWAVARSEAVPGDDLTRLRREHAEGVAAAEIRPAGDGFRWDWSAAAGDLARLLWPIAWSATELLTGGELARVKVCPGAGGIVPCAWLFYDASKNRSRQWCSMEDCGAVDKARRQTARRRTARAAGPPPPADPWLACSHAPD